MSSYKSKCIKNYNYFLCNETSTTEIYTYLHTHSLHDALPILRLHPALQRAVSGTDVFDATTRSAVMRRVKGRDTGPELKVRLEEHTSELQSLMRISYAVFCLIKKKNIKLSR